MSRRWPLISWVLCVAGAVCMALQWAPGVYMRPLAWFVLAVHLVLLTALGVGTVRWYRSTRHIRSQAVVGRAPAARQLRVVKQPMAGERG